MNGLLRRLIELVSILSLEGPATNHIFLREIEVVTHESVDVAELRARQKALASIRATMRMSRGDFRRRDPARMVCSLMFGLIVYVVLLQCTAWSIPIILFVSLVLCGLMFLLLKGRVGLSGTFEQALDAMLATYSPTSIHAFAILQERTRVRGRLNYEELRDWTEREGEEISHLLARLEPSKYEFTKRVL